MQRPVIIHYHIFKNAGTSLDQALKEHFGSRWTEIEGPGRRLLSPREVGLFIESNPSIAALSSHTATLPVPKLAGVHAIPVVFIRHPLDRLRSAYDFERVQDTDTPGALKAKETDLAGYIEWRLARPQDVSAESFQTFRLAQGMPGSGDLLERALQTITELPFVGLVEEYGASIERLEKLLADYFPGIRLRSYRSNVTGGHEPLEERLRGLRQRVGNELYARLEDANRDDLAIWEAVRAAYIQAASSQ